MDSFLSTSQFLLFISFLSFDSALPFSKSLVFNFTFSPPPFSLFCIDSEHYYCYEAICHPLPKLLPHPLFCKGNDIRISCFERKRINHRPNLTWNDKSNQKKRSSPEKYSVSMETEYRWRRCKSHKCGHAPGRVHIGHNGKNNRRRLFSNAFESLSSSHERNPDRTKMVYQSESHGFMTSIVRQERAPKTYRNHHLPKIISLIPPK